MKPLRLELRGFTAFRRSAVIDFRGRSLFAITGPTGAGKSSLLDAMTWALYGQVPRVGRSTHQLVTHGEKSMAVRFDFVARGHVYRVTRTTAGAIGTRLEERAPSPDGAAGNERWRLLADRAGEVTKQVGDLIGLDYATFIKTIVLPQGEFGSFLRGEERERRDILSTLLGLGTYEAAGRAARTRAREAQQSALMLTRQLEQLTFGTPEALAGLEAERAALLERATTHDAMRAGLATVSAAAAVHLEAARALDEAQRSDIAARQACTDAERSLAEALAGVEEARASLERLHAERAALAYDPEAHRRLQRAVQLLEARAAAARALEEARAAELQARAALEAATHAVANAEQQRDQQRAVALEARAAHENALAALCRAALRGRALALGLRHAEEEAEAAAHAAEFEALTLAEVARQAEAFAGEARAIALEETRAASALAGARIDLVAVEAASAAGAESAALADASLEARRDALQTARTQHAAAALRSGLAPGDPCPVCGGPIDQLPLHATPDLDAAQAAVAAAETVLRAALEEQRASLARSAAAAARIEGLEGECARLGARRAGLELAVREAGLACGANHPEPLARAAAEALDGASRAQLGATAERARLAALRDTRHALELRLAETAPRLGPLEPDTALDDEAQPEVSPEAASEAAATLGERLELEGARAAASTTLEAAARLAGEAATQATGEAARAAQAIEVRSAAVAAAERQLESLAGGDLDPAWGADPAPAIAALAVQDALASRAAALEEATKEAVTELAVRDAIVAHRRAHLERARIEATASAAGLEATRCTAEAAEAEFARQWRALLGTEAAPSVPALQALTQHVEAEAREVAQRVGGIEARLEQARAEIEQAARLREEVTGCEATAAVSGALERELHADRFIAYVQREALAVLAADASARLLHLTGGRYRLVGEADEFYVIDHLNGDERRSVRTLSGGETFLASLALALALSERLPELAGVGGALSLESLFLDEGFGSLDAASLDIAIEGLERLAGGRRMIGVISHVPEIAERLPDRIDVLKAPAGSSIAAGDVVGAGRAPDLIEG